MTFNLNELYDLSGQVAVVTGGGGVLCRALCLALGQLQVKVVVMGQTVEKAQKVADEITAQGGQALAISCDVLNAASLEAARDGILARFGRVDILVNGAGGNKPQANTAPDRTFFDLSPDALRWVVDLNLMGTILPSQVFGKIMAAQKSGVMLNFSSMNYLRPLSRVPAYSAAKAGMSNFTQWLAVHMAQEYSPQIRVNAVAPGFFVGAQNRSLLLKEDGSLTPRGQSIIAHTPMGRFGVPDDLLGTMLWLVSPASAFVTGIIVPVDGGFSAFGGV